MEREVGTTGTTVLSDWTIQDDRAADPFARER
jgi:hypothetical protein